MTLFCIAEIKQKVQHLRNTYLQTLFICMYGIKLVMYIFAALFLGGEQHAGGGDNTNKKVKYYQKTCWASRERNRKDDDGLMG